MKRFSIFCAALFAAATSFAAVTYELNGGVTNADGWLDKKGMYEGLNADWNAYSGSTKTWRAYEEQLGVSKSNGGIPTAITSADDILGFFASEAYAAKWGWLPVFLDAKAVEQGKVTLPSTAAFQMRYGLGNFFGEDNNGALNWIGAIDGTGANASIAAFQPYWKGGFANPTEPTAEFVLNDPYKEGESFLGWYWNADFSGDKVTKIDATSNGTLYAKFGEYIPTIAEVRALAAATETKVSGVVNFIDGNNLYIQDATGGVLVVAAAAPTCKVGDKIVAKGTTATEAGAPVVKNAAIESAEASTLLPIAQFESFTPLIDDTQTLRYFGTRVSIPSVRIISLDNNNNPTIEDSAGNKVLCYKMSVDPIVYPVGTKVTVTAVAGWNNGFQFVGDAAGIVRPIAGKKENYTYPVRSNGRYALENNWVISTVEDNYAANKPGTNDFVRGMAAKDGIMYFINRELMQIVRVDGKTGNMLSPIVLQGTDTLFKSLSVDATTGETTWADGTILPYNDIKFDQAGNCLIGACMTGATKCQTFYIYIVDLATGKCTKLIEDVLWENPGLDQVQFRFDAFGVAGDVTKNGVVMAADAGGSWNVYRWLIENGVAGEGEQVAIVLNPAVDQSLYITAAGFGSAPQILPQDREGTLFYVDGFNTLPMLFYGNPTEGAILMDDFINVPTGTTVTNNEGEKRSMNSGHNGLVEFQVGNEYFLLMAATNTVGSPTSAFALYKFADEDRAFAGMVPLWYFPSNGLGSTTNGCHTAPVSVEVKGNVANLYVYTINNGYASYTLTIDPTIDPAKKYQLTVLSNNDSMGSVSGTGSYIDGKNVTIEASAKNGYRFTHWSDGNTENPRVVNITQDTTFTAYFSEDLYNITTNVNNTTAGFALGTGTYNYGTYTEISATANQGYHFSHWNDGKTSNPRVVQVTGDKTYTAYFYKDTYTVSVNYNSTYGTVEGPTSGEYMDNITLTATPNLGYAFVKWSDGVTTNPRTIVLTQNMALSANFMQAYSGQCGKSLYWKYDPESQTIAITGSGNMYHYTATTQPWILFKEQIRKVEVSNEATSLGTSAFEGCRSLGEVHLGLDMIDIYDNVFAGCKRLYHIYCYPTYPPFAESSAFANYSADLHIPCEATEGYQRDEVWGLFNIQCMGAETEDIPSGEVTTTTTNTSVTITWPTDENADTYTIEIKNGDQVFCTLTFSKDGQLTNIAFAPGRNRQHRAQYAELTAKGLRFTVTNLNSGTQYSYDVTTKDKNNIVIDSHTGEFTTKKDIATDIDTTTSTESRVQKLLRDGQLIIVRDGVEYNALGDEL